MNGKKLAAHELIAELNKIGGKHGVGVTVLAENRLVGMKSRGVYETPGGTILYEAHKALEQICIERDTLHYKQQVALRYAELVYNGQWFHPLREALQTFIDHTNATVTGTAKVRLFKGRAMHDRRDEPAHALRPAARQLQHGRLRRHRRPRVHRSVRPADEGREPGEEVVIRRLATARSSQACYCGERFRSGDIGPTARG